MAWHAEVEVRMLNKGEAIMVFEPGFFVKIAPGDTAVYRSDKGHNAESVDLHDA
jgi:plastocyanin